MLNYQRVVIFHRSLYCLTKPSVFEHGQITQGIVMARDLTVESRWGGLS